MTTRNTPPKDPDTTLALYRHYAAAFVSAGHLPELIDSHARRMVDLELAYKEELWEATVTFGVQTGVRETLEAMMAVQGAEGRVGHKVFHLDWYPNEIQLDTDSFERDGTTTVTMFFAPAMAAAMDYAKYLETVQSGVREFFQEDVQVTLKDYDPMEDSGAGYTFTIARVLADRNGKVAA